MITLSFLSIVVAVLLFEPNQAHEIIVKTPLGELKGLTLKTHNGRDILAFRGVPFAEPPVKEKRFKPAELISKWEGIKDATKDGKLCPQPHLLGPKFSNSEMSEDCLILNVYSNNLTANAPVLFFIHGGAFQIGGSNSEKLYGPEYLLDKNVVLVTSNHRLGAFGFLSTATAEAPGNNGLKDQVVALRWVRDNIRSFGGDPNSVTIFGESTGGFSVSALLVSPMSKGLFHRAIPMSGSVTNHHPVLNQRYTHKLIEDAGCKDDVDPVKCLRKLPWEKIIEICLAWDKYRLVNVKWGYEIEKDFGQERYLAEDPTTLFARGEFHRVPIMAGLTKDEFDEIGNQILNNTELVQALNTDFSVPAPRVFHFDSNSSTTNEIAKSLKEFYLKNKEITKENSISLGQLFSDAVVSHGLHRLVELTRQYTDVYYYRFDFPGRDSLVGAPSKHQAGHGDELQYLFEPNWIGGGNFKQTDPESLMVVRLTELWERFAKTGNPNEDAASPKWLPTNKSGIRTMIIDKEMTMTEGEPYHERFDFWDKLFPVKK